MPAVLLSQQNQGGGEFTREGLPQNFLYSV